MSSVLTNKGAMIALETLRGINKNLADVQSQISTGKKISTSTDNAAIWSIATVMESDVKSFEQITDSLNLGSATVGVAQSAANQVTNLLQDAKALIVAANDASVTDEDRQKYQTDINELRGTINNIVDAASFNGQNLLKGTGTVQVLSSLNRQDDGTVTAGRISVARQNLSANAEIPNVSAATVAGGASGITAEGGITLAASVADADTDTTLTINGGDGAVTAGSTYSFTATRTGGAATVITYEAQAGDDLNDVATGLIASIASSTGATGLTAVVTTPADDAGGDLVLTITNGNADPGGGGNLDVAFSAISTDIAEQEAEAAGGLADLSEIDITTVDGAEAALSGIDVLLQTAIDATAEFGSKVKRIDNQNEFITTLTNSLKTGVGAMTDANLEEASARLQSLQVQQQLGTQSLSIANQAPQALLSLFQ